MKKGAVVLCFGNPLIQKSREADCHGDSSFVAALGLTVPACTQKKNEPLNTVHLVSIAKIKGLDPIQADDLYANDEVSRAYEGLYQYHYLKRPFVLVPNLAEAMPEVSKDGRTYTIRLKQGVLFQDDPAFKATEGKGRELEAADFVYSWKRLADPAQASTGCAVGVGWKDWKG